MSNGPSLPICLFDTHRSNGCGLVSTNFVVAIIVHLWLGRAEGRSVAHVPSPCCNLYHPVNARWKSRFVGTIRDK
jgi:hypothetical protein